MSNFLGVAHVTAALKTMLADRVKETGIGFDVSMKRPDQLGAQNAAHINVYLYQITRNVHAGNHDLPTRNADGDLGNLPRVAIDLHYLVSFYGDEDRLESQRLMASTLRVLHEEPLLAKHWIQAAFTDGLYNDILDPPPSPTPALSIPPSNLDLNAEPIRFVQTALSLEEMSKLWSVFFQTHYALSVAYSASVVFIERESPRVIPKQVLERNVEVVTLSTAKNEPSSIAGLGLWLRSDKGLRKKSDGSIEWLDQSGKERHAHEVVANAPSVLPHAIGSRPALRFNGAAQLALDWTMNGSVHAVTVCAVHRTQGTIRRSLISFGADAYWELGVDQDPPVGSWITGGRELVTTLPAFDQDHPERLDRTDAELGNGWRVQLATFSSGTAAAERFKELWLNGVQVALDPAAVIIPLSSTDPRTGLLGASVGDTGTDRNFFLGDIAEVIVFERALLEQERSNLFRYLSDQYGIP